MDIQYCWDEDTTGCICGNECEPPQWMIKNCWDEDTTGCICGNECEPPQWMIKMWEAEERANQEKKK